MPGSNELRNLQQRLSRTTDLAERQEIVACVLAQIEIGWNDLFELLANEQNSERMLLMLAELDRMFEERKAELTATVKWRTADLSAEPG